MQQYGNKKKRHSGEQAAGLTGDSTPLAKRTRSNYPDFVPEVLPAKCRTESATRKPQLHFLFLYKTSLSYRDEHKGWAT